MPEASGDEESNEEKGILLQNQQNQLTSYAVSNTCDFHVNSWHM